MLRTKRLGFGHFFPPLNIFAGVANTTARIPGVLYDSLMLKEDAMTHYTDTDNTDGHTLYVLLVSLLATVMSFPAVWYFATHAVPAVLA